MDPSQVAQFRSQLKIVAQLATCGTTNTLELDRASGVDPDPKVRQIQFSHAMHAHSTWKICPDCPHHHYMQCSIGDFSTHQIPMALLAQERDNYVVMKMQTHLRQLRIAAKANVLSTEEHEKYEFMTHMLWMNSRQRYVRDQFYRSYVAFSAGNPLKNRDITSIVRLKPLSATERKKAFVIRGHIYNKFLWPTGPEFVPETPFTPLPRYVIRDRQKLNPDVDLTQTLPTVGAVVSGSASLMISSFAYEFFLSARSKYAQVRVLQQQLMKREISVMIEKKLEALRTRLSSLIESDPVVFAEFWEPPFFSRSVRLVRAPSNLNECTLHPHQLEGLSWLIHMYDHHVNAILADDVGLGKSLEIISFIAFLKEQRRVSGPHLITMPVTVITTWKDEFAKWYPTAHVRRYIGKRAARRQIFETDFSHQDFEILLAPYSLVEKDSELLSRIPWRVMVFDEGHKLKNSNTSLFRLVDDNLSADFRIITTATPFQNDLHELWSLLYLIAPTRFCSVEIFDAFFREVENSGDEAKHALIIERLHTILRPYVLRRVKSDLDFDIPTKHEVTLKCTASALQLEILRCSVALDLPMRQKLTLSRKLSNSPALFLPSEHFPAPYLLSRSPKLALLDRIVRRLALTGHRFLIYSQWTSMMDVIEVHLAWRGLQFLRIDGSVSTAARMEIIQRFVAPGSPFVGMILSTRSSAFGLNLQVADTVVLFDSDYNPFVELQASARVHRLGQTRAVVVIRLLMVGTGEEQILRVARRKLLLGSEIIEGGRFNLRVRNSSPAEELPVSVPEIWDPSDEDLNGILARAPEDVGVMQFAGDGGNLEDERSFEEFDARILEAFSQVLDPPEASDDEWEAC